MNKAHVLLNFLTFILMFIHSTKANKDFGPSAASHYSMYRFISTHKHCGGNPIEKILTDVNRQIPIGITTRQLIFLLKRSLPNIYEKLKTQYKNWVYCKRRID